MAQLTQGSLRLKGSVNKHGVASIQYQLAKNGQLSAGVKATNISNISQYLQVALIPNTQQLLWEVLSEESGSFKLLLDFEDPLRISKKVSNQSRSEVRITMNYTVSSSTTKGIQQQFSGSVSLAIPRQYPSYFDEGSVYSYIDQPKQATVQYPLGILLILNLCMKAGSSISLQYLWDYINSLQLIALIPLMGLSLPPNLQTMLNYIAGPLSFNFLERADFGLWLFALNETLAADDYPAYNTVFSEYGYESSLAVLNLQDTVIYIFVFVIVLPLTLLLVSLRGLRQRFRMVE